MGQTFSEKLLGSKAGQKVKAGDIVIVFRELGLKHLPHPERLVVILDHVVPASSEKYALNHKIIREFVKEQRINNFFDVNYGICHQVLTEQGLAAPGKLIIGADSHTTTYGALGALAVGVGRSEVASVWATGEIWLRVPETIQIQLEGSLPPGVAAKDIILSLIGEHGADKANYQAVEFAGEGATCLSIASRMVLCNMAAEMGAKNGYFLPDQQTLDYLHQRGVEDYEVINSDPDAD